MADSFFWIFWSTLRKGDFGVHMSDFFDILYRTHRGGTFAQLCLLGCFCNGKICTKMRVSTVFFDFLVILVLREHFFCTTKSGIFRFFGQKGTFLMGGPFLGFRSTPSSYRLVPKLARRDRFKNDKIGPKQGLPRNFLTPLRFSIFWSGMGHFFGENIFFLFFSSAARARRAALKSL